MEKPEGNDEKLVERTDVTEAGAAVPGATAPEAVPQGGQAAEGQEDWQPAESTEQVKANLKLESQHRSGASWFYWIAGLSVINTISVLLGWDWSFIAGLIVTQIIDGFALGLSTELGGSIGPILSILAVLLDLMIAGVFVLFGVFAHKKHAWSFITGLVLYVLDALLCLLFQDFLSALVHLLALYGIFMGYRAMKQMAKAPAR